MHTAGFILLVIGGALAAIALASLLTIPIVHTCRRRAVAWLEKHRSATARKLMYKDAQRPGGTRAWLRMLSGETVPLDYNPDESTEFVAVRIHVQTGIDPESQQLICDGKTITRSDTTKIGDKIAAGATLQLIVAAAAKAANLNARVHPTEACPDAVGNIDTE